MEDHSKSARRVFVSGLKLFSGTGGAQVVMVVAIPILTRLHTTAEFGDLGMFMAGTTLLSVLISGRYEIAIPLPVEDRDGWALFIATLRLGAALACLGLLFALVTPEFLFSSIPRMFRFLILLPFAIFSMMGITTTEYWLNRKGCFSTVSWGRFIGSLVMAGTQIGLGVLGWGGLGLISGFLIGLFTTFFINSVKSWQVRPPVGGKYWELMRQYSRFPKFMLLAQVCNSASNHFPVIAFGTYFGVSSAGTYTMANRTMTMVDLLASAVGQAFYPELAKKFAAAEDCYILLKKTLQKLAWLALAFFPLLFAIGPTLFAWCFGENWRQSGEIVRWILPMFVMRFVSYPATLVPMIAGRQDLYLLRQIFLFIFVVASLIAGWQSGSFKMTLFLYSAVYSFFYFLDMYIGIKILREGKFLLRDDPLSAHRA